jgi:chromosome segregation ATPase
MKKILFILAFILAVLIVHGQKEITLDTSVIHLFDKTIIEEFKTIDKDGNQLTSYRRMDKKSAKDYIEKIRQENETLQERLEMFKSEAAMYKSMMDDMVARRAEVQATIQENKRRIEEYKKYLK